MNTPGKNLAARLLGATIHFPGARNNSYDGGYRDGLPVYLTAKDDLKIKLIMTDEESKNADYFKKHLTQSERQEIIDGIFVLPEYVIAAYLNILKQYKDFPKQRDVSLAKYFSNTLKQSGCANQRFNIKGYCVEIIYPTIDKLLTDITSSFSQETSGSKQEKADFVFATLQKMGVDRSYKGLRPESLTKELVNKACGITEERYTQAQYDQADTIFKDPNIKNESLFKLKSKENGIPENLIDILWKDLVGGENNAIDKP